MKRLFVALCALGLSAALIPDSAEAARVGGGRSAGVQRAAPMQRQAQPAAPAQQPKQATQPTQPTQPAQPAPAGNRWLGPLAGLAAGLGLGWLLGQGGLGGLGGVIGSVMLMLLVGFAAMMLFRMFARRNAASTPPLQYAGLGNETVPAPPPSQMPAAASGAQPDFRSQFQSQIPAGFDSDGFLKQAKLNFVRLQQVNDRGELEALRDVTTAEMFESLKSDIESRTGPQQTEVVSLGASLLEVVTEGNAHWASVHFAGSIRESAGGEAVPFEEVWNLQKPIDGKSGWLLAGIQQPGA